MRYLRRKSPLIITHYRGTGLLIVRTRLAFNLVSYNCVIITLMFYNLCSTSKILVKVSRSKLDGLVTCVLFWIHVPHNIKYLSSNCCLTRPDLTSYKVTYKLNICYESSLGHCLFLCLYSVKV